jgi:hypothetical protein
MWRVGTDKTQITFFELLDGVSDVTKSLSPKHQREFKLRVMMPRVRITSGSYVDERKR